MKPNPLIVPMDADAIALFDRSTTRLPHDSAQPLAPTSGRDPRPSLGEHRQGGVDQGRDANPAQPVDPG